MTTLTLTRDGASFNSLLATTLVLMLLLTACSDDDDSGTNPDDNNPDPDLVEVEMIEIPAGTFMMGGEKNFNEADERPVHQVTITKDFYLAKFETTGKLWREVMGDAGNSYVSDDRPAGSVTWFEAVEFCNKLSELNGFAAAYTIEDEEVSWNRDADGYRLPTEAEWEYACRAGTATDFYNGDLTVGTGVDPLLEEIAWYESESGAERFSRPVGQKKPNNFGLYDMLGNVSEWCWDFEYDYTADAQVDPVGPDTGTRRIGRGGSAGTVAHFTTCSNRLTIPMSFEAELHSFRFSRNK